MTIESISMNEPYGEVCLWPLTNDGNATERERAVN